MSAFGPRAATEFKAMFAEFNLRGLRLKNRFVLSPMTRARAGPALLPTPTIRDYYAQFASAGLEVTEGVHVSPAARGWVDVPGIWTADQTEKWKPVTEAVHQRGGVIFMQLWHQGRNSHTAFHPGRPPVAPSPIPLPGEIEIPGYTKVPHEVPHALTVDEIKRTVEDYARAAMNAKAAGFDGVELHGANGYLLDQFLQSKTNQRTDAYGGSVANRFRVVGEVLDAVIGVWGTDRVGIRFSPNGTYNNMGSKDFREQFSYAIHETGKRGVAYVHVVDGLAFGFHKLGEPFTLAEARKLLPSNVALIGNCGYTPEKANEQVAAGNADMISFARTYLANPDLPERVANGWPIAPPPHQKYWYSPKGKFPPEEGYIVPRYQPSQTADAKKDAEGMTSRPTPATNAGVSANAQQ